MKRIIILILAVTVSLTFYGQEKATWSVDDIFNGKVVPKREMKRTHVQGDRLAALRLIEFSSVQFSANEQRLALISSIIVKTADMHNDKEIESEGNILTYAFITLSPSEEGYNRYIGYSAKKKEKDYSITVLYFTGQASAEELKKKLAK